MADHLEPAPDHQDHRERLDPPIRNADCCPKPTEAWPRWTLFAARRDDLAPRNRSAKTAHRLLMSGSFGKPSGGRPLLRRPLSPTGALRSHARSRLQCAPAGRSADCPVPFPWDRRQGPGRGSRAHRKPPHGGVRVEDFQLVAPPVGPAVRSSEKGPVVRCTRLQGADDS